MMSAQGQCLCGAVAVTIAHVGQSLGVCHCNMCRKWSGGPWLALDVGTDVSFTGEDFVQSYASSEWATRGFCKQCGTHLYFRLNASGQYFISSELLNGEHDFKLDHQIFIDEKPAYYDFANQTKMLSGADVIAQFST